MDPEFYITNGTHEWGPYDENCLREKHAEQVITDDTLLQCTRGGARRTYRDLFVLKIVELPPPPKQPSPSPALSTDRFTFLTWFLVSSLAFWLVSKLGDWRMLLAVGVISTANFACRLRDIRLSGWWSLLAWIPVLGASPIVGLCLLAPTRFAEAGKLDGVTRLATWLYGLGAIVLFVPMMMAIAKSPADMLPIFLLYLALYSWIAISFVLAVSLVRRQLKA
jgi:hypothetical protein